MLSKNTLQGFWLLIRADKPIGTYLLLWPTLWGVLIASEGTPSLHVALVFCLGVFLMRSAGCVINDYADRNIDGKVKRTNARPLVSGQVTEKQALSLFMFLVLLAFVLVLTLNWQTVALSFVALFLAALYPFMKRFTYLPQFVLGAAFSFGIPMAFMAVQESIPWYAWLVYIANLFWTVAYDTEYAMVDRDDDLKIGVKSTAILFGDYDRLIIGLFQVLTLGMLSALVFVLQWHWPTYVALAVIVGLFVYQQKLIWARERDACFKAFLHNNNVGWVFSLALIIEYAVYW